MNRAQAKALGLKRYTTGRTCPKGHPVERFVSTGSCVECLRIHNAKWQSENRETYLAALRRSNRKRYASNPEAARAESIKWSRKNPGLAKARFQRWYAVNSHRVIAAAKAWSEANPARARESDRKSAHTRRAKLKSVGGTYTQSDIQTLYLEQGALCVYCRVFLADKFEIDHRLPIALGGSNNPDNLQLLCPSCNRRKSAKHPDVFEKELKVRA